MRFRSSILLVHAALVLGAQEKPDFSGRWVLAEPERPGPEVPRALSVRQSLVRTNVRGEPMTPYFKDIAVERDFGTVTRSATYAIGVAGGSVSGVVGHNKPAGLRGHHSVKWDGGALVFEIGDYTGEMPGTGEWSERREVWSLDSAGRLRVSITTRGSLDASGTTTVSIYRRI
jgi:hypothetical protein